MVKRKLLSRISGDNLRVFHFGLQARTSDHIFFHFVFLFAAAMNKRSLQDVCCGDLDDEDLSVKPAPDDEDYRAPIMASSSAGPSNKRTRPSEPGHSTKAGGTSSSNIKGSPSKKAPVFVKVRSDASMSKI